MLIVFDGVDLEGRKVLSEASMQGFVPKEEICRLMFIDHVYI